MVGCEAAPYKCKAAPFDHLDMENQQQERLLLVQELHQEANEAPKSEASDHQKSKSCVVNERDALRRELDAQKAETRALYAEVLEMEKRNEECEIELRQARRERDGLLGETREMERRLETVMEESASIVSSLIAVQSDIEEQMARKVRDGRISTGRTILILKNAGRMLSMPGEVKEEDRGCGSPVDGRDEIGEEIVRKFAAGFEAIHRNFRSELEKMEEMKRKVELLKGCVEEEMRKKRCY